MPVPSCIQPHLDKISTDFRQANNLTASILGRNVNGEIENIRAYADLPDGAEAAIQRVREEGMTLSMAVRQFAMMGPAGESAIEKVRAGALLALADLVRVLGDAVPSERARILGIG